MEDQDSAIEKINRHLESIELRLKRLESASLTSEPKNFSPKEVSTQPEASTLTITNPPDEAENGFEYNIGRFGLAWLGNIVLLFGIIFLTQYLINIGHQFLSVTLGYLSVAAIFILAIYLKKSDDNLAFTFRLNAQILLFSITLRMHFFTISPLIANSGICLTALLLLVALQVYISIRNKSQAYGALAVIFSLTTAIVGDTTHFTLPLVLLTSAGTIWYFIRFNWKPLLLVTIFMTYISFFLWLFGNALMGHPMQLISEHHSGVIYLYGLGASFSTLLFFRKKNTGYDDFLIGVTIINGILFTLLLLLVVLRFYLNDYVGLFGVITICCLVYSTILHSKSDWNFGSAFYALYGFMAMSISLYGLVGLPKVYLLLSVQSLIVVSMALWFRNKLIVVMNSLLFLTILTVYLLSSKSVNEVNFSFAMIALISARIINWRSSRLQIKTDLMRNLYMIEGFVMMLYALSQALPKQFVTLSWTLAALLYFMISFILKNIKYRYMALGTMICAAFYLFLVDLARIELIYRVLALLFLAAISIGISMYYTNRIKNSDK